MTAQLHLKPDELDKLHAAADVHPMHFVKEHPALAEQIGRAMRIMCPEPGDDWDKFMCVLLQPGVGIEEHAHRRHTVLFYPEACDGPVVDGEQRDVLPGEIIHLAPDVPHSVPTARRRRLSVAMLVQKRPPEGGLT